MKIQFKDYRIDQNEYGGFDLIKEKVTKTGKKVGNKYDYPIGHYTSVTKCVKRIAIEELYQQDELTDLKGFIEAYNNITEEIKEACYGV